MVSRLQGRSIMAEGCEGREERCQLTASRKQKARKSLGGTVPSRAHPSDCLLHLGRLPGVHSAVCGRSSSGLSHRPGWSPHDLVFASKPLLCTMLHASNTGVWGHGRSKLHTGPLAPARESVSGLLRSTCGLYNHCRVTRDVGKEVNNCSPVPQWAGTPSLSLAQHQPSGLYGPPGCWEMGLGSSRGLPGTLALLCFSPGLVGSYVEDGAWC